MSEKPSSLQDYIQEGRARYEARERKIEPWVEFEDEAWAYGFTQVPNIVLRSPFLSPPAKTLYGLLLSYAWESPECEPGRERLMRECNVKSNTTFQNVKTELENCGLIQVRRRGQGRTSLYRINKLTEFQRYSNRTSEGTVIVHKEDPVKEDSSKKDISNDISKEKEKDLREESIEEEPGSGQPGDQSNADLKRKSEQDNLGRDRGKVKKLTNEEARSKWEELCENDPHGEALAVLAEIMAEENKSGEVAITKVWRNIGQRYLDNRNRYVLGNDAWLHGFSVAISKGVGNIGYVTEAAKKYEPGTGAGAKVSQISRPEEVFVDDYVRVEETSTCEERRQTRIKDLARNYERRGSLIYPEVLEMKNWRIRPADIGAPNSVVDDFRDAPGIVDSGSEEA